MYLDTETNRLVIRPISLHDAAFILALVNTEGWLQYIGQRQVSNLQEAEAYIQKMIDNPHVFYNVFLLKATQTPIGVVTLLRRDEYPYPDIGFALLPAHEKQGYVYEAARKYLDEIKASATYEYVLGITLPDNAKSIRLLEKLGLGFKENVLKEQEKLSVYSLKTIK